MVDNINSPGFFDGTIGNQAPTAPLDRKTLVDYKDYMMQELGGPGYVSPMVNMLSGVRIFGPGNQMISLPDDTIGLALVSRPCLNLSDDNVILHEQLAPLYQPNKNTLMAYIKGLLDPVWGRANSGSVGSILDPLSAWIAPCSNLLKVSSGFPDISMEMGKSSPGFRGEVYQFPSGLLKVNYDFDMVQTYHPSKPNILPYLFEAWLHYFEGVTLGDEGLEPYPEALIENYIDYDCRIYHLIMNRNLKNIEGIYCTGSSIPKTFPSGSFSTIDRTQSSLRGQGQDELSITFSSVGMRFGNIKVADMFNRCTLKFNPGLLPATRETTYRKLSMAEYFMGGYHSYPWINIDTMEMEYWSKI